MAASDNNLNYHQNLNNDNREYNDFLNNSSIEEILNISDNFGHNITIYRNEFNSIETFKNVIFVYFFLKYFVSISLVFILLIFIILLNIFLFIIKTMITYTAQKTD